MSTYNLLSGPFGLCSGIWDEHAKIFRRADDTEKGECCFNTCKPFVQKCVENCPKASSTHFEDLCYKTCHDIKESCKNNCLLSSNSWSLNNPIYDGTKKFGCGDGFGHSINEECLKKHKDGILKECQRNCLPTQDLDCQKHCIYSYNFLTDDKADPLSFDRVIGTRSSDSSGSSGISSWGGISLYILFYSLVFVVIMLGIYILIKRK